MKLRRTLPLLLTALLAFAVLPSCDKDPLNNGTSNNGNNGENNGSGDNTGGSGNDGGYTAEEGLAYVFDGSCIPEVHISVTLGQWNALLKAYDADSNTSTYISCDVLYDKA